MKTRSLILVFAAAAAGCQSSAPTWYHDVKPIVDGRCVSCHTEGGIGPFSLTNYDSAKAMAPAISAAVKSRQMPPWHAGQADVTYSNDPSLTQAQIDAISEWAEEGAVKGDPKAKVVEVPKVAGGISRVDLELNMKGAYSPVLDPDDYRCFPIDWPYQDLRYITGF
ncbi:MAG: c-type cytochrome, partial [Myxococcaceae bacterium]